MKKIKMSGYFTLFFVIFSVFIAIFVLLKIPNFQKLIHILPFCMETSNLPLLLISSVSAQFTHLDFFHLLGNSIFLGYLIKEAKGFFKIRYIILTSISGILFVAVCLLIFADQTKTYVGASGWLGALLAVCLIEKLKSNNFKINKSNVDIACVSLSFLVLPFVSPTVSLLMHLSGFLFGVLFNFTINYKSDNRRDVTYF